MATRELLAVLDAREERWFARQALSVKHRKAVLSTTLRLPLNLRREYPDLLERETEAFLHALGAPVLEQTHLANADGPACLVAVDMEAVALKQQAVLWENTRLGVFLDFDVCDSQGHQLSRTLFGLPPRPCLLCERDARLCMKAAAHSEADIRTFLENQLLPPPASAPERIARLACLAVEDELRLEDKPGLVTPSSRGAHRDMDFALLLKSAGVLAPFWRQCAELGASSAAADCQELFRLLRVIGKETEDAMFVATGGVNTHKGLLFALSLVCAACGRAWHTGTPQTEQVLAIVQAMTQGLVARELQHKSAFRSIGEKAYARLGVSGARGQAEAGFPHVLGQALPLLLRFKEANWKIARQNALLGLMAVMDDTNLIHRGGAEGLRAVQQAAGTLLTEGGVDTDTGADTLKRLCALCLERNLSPGGSADMLVLGCFFYRLNSLQPSITR